MALPNFPKLKDIVRLKKPFRGIKNPFEELEDEVGPFAFPVATAADLRKAQLSDALGPLSTGLLTPPAIGIVLSYFTFLETQGRNRFKTLPTALRNKLKPHYAAINPKNVKYAESINTLQADTAVTLDQHIFFPTAVNLGDRGDVAWLAHELQHCVQYSAIGGKVAFLRKYLADIIDKVISSRSFNVHDLLELEKDADEVSSRVMQQIGSSLG